MLFKSLLLTSFALGVVLPVGPAAQASSIALTASSAAYAAQDSEAPKKKRKSRKVQSMTLAVNKKITKVQEFIELKQYAEATEILDELRDGSKINDYERSIVWQFYASVAYEQDDYPGTIRAYEEVLKLRESIPEAMEIALMYNLSQLYNSQENYEKAISYYQQWESRSEVIGVKQIFYGSTLYYLSGDYRKSIQYAKKTIDEAAKVDTVEPEEQWYTLMLSAYWELNDFPNVSSVLETLIVNWPKPKYWRQLAGIYQELGKEEASFSITEAAYKQGFFDDDANMLVNVAQILIARDAPIKAAWVIEDAYGKQLVERTAKNDRTLASAYARSAEYAKAVGPMSSAAAGDDSLDPDGMMWLQVASYYNQLDRLNEAVDAYEKAIKLLKQEKTKKSKRNISQAYMSRGTALIELKRFDAARKSFAEAKKLGAKASTLKSWGKYLELEEAREKILASAGR